MSNEIKYVNEAGVRRIVTDTRARLIDLTTDVDSAFGFSLDLSDIDTRLTSTDKVISFSLPKGFSTDEYDIFARMHIKSTRNSTNESILQAEAHAEALVPLTSDTSRKKVAELRCRSVNLFTRNRTTEYDKHVVHNKSTYYQENVSIFSTLTSSAEGIYNLSAMYGISHSSLVTDIHGTTVGGTVTDYRISPVEVNYSAVNASDLGLSFDIKIEAIEILVRKKLEATLSNE